MLQSAIESRIVSYVAKTLGVPPATVRCNATFAELGLDSVAAAILTEDLGEELCLEIDLVSLYDHPTPQDFAAFLASRVQQDHPGGREPGA